MYKISICPRCGIEFENKTNRTFCCRKCANVRIHSEETKRKISKGVINSYNYRLPSNSKENIIYKNRVANYYKTPKECPICHKVLEYNKRKHTTCSKDCYIKWQTERALKQKMHGCGRGGWYKGIYCDSTYELAYVIYCLDHNIDIKRNEEYFIYEYKGKQHRYYPDFIVNNELIEIKGYHTDLVDIKLKCVNKPIKILYYDDMKYMFDYIKNQYNKNKSYIIELYDNITKCYKYICDNCGKEFISYTKRKTIKVFCCRHCSGSYPKSDEIKNKIKLNHKGGKLGSSLMSRTVDFDSISPGAEPGSPTKCACS